MKINFNHRLIVCKSHIPSFLVLGLILCSPAMVYSETLNWHPWSDQTFQQAKQDNKLVLLDLSTKWCQFCEKMHNTTYRDPMVISTLNDNYLVIKVNETDVPSLTQKYQHDGRTTTVIFSPDGSEIIKHVGYIRPQRMNWMLQTVSLKPHAEAHL
ncbi:MAG: hypothetical protein COB51_04270 [Moraxellaceae bacterium]|nr:MAG: hypothetical protein COB51_04270 [Moraxellaceae bacterium]